MNIMIFHIKKKNSFININNICLNIIKVTSNKLYNNNYD